MLPGMPSVEGIWFNPSTKDYFEVLETYQDDNDMWVTTKDGRKVSFAQLENYIQSDLSIDQLKQVYGDPRNALGNEISKTALTQGVDANDAQNILGQTQPAAPENPMLKGMAAQPAAPAAPAPKSSNYDIIDRALANAKIEYEVSVTWKSIPTEAIKLLTTIMGVPMSEIADYCFEKYSQGFVADMKLSLAKELSK